MSDFVKEHASSPYKIDTEIIVLQAIIEKKKKLTPAKYIAWLAT